MTKICFKCNKEKDLSMFYVHKQMNDGHLGKCIECTKEDVAEHRQKNIERIRAYDRERGKLPYRKKLMTKTVKAYRKKYPLRKIASNMLNNALRDGRIPSKPKICSMCNIKATRIYGHHDDYYKPLEVKWVCQPCHKTLH